jgi:hypothetical protein
MIESFGLKDETEQARLLQDETIALHDRFINEPENQKEIVVLNTLLFKKLIEFEKNLINFEILAFIYVDIGRVALNCFNFRDAVKYAHAGIEFSRVIGDQNGVDVSSRILLDTACAMGSFKGASKVLDEYPNLEEKGFRAAIDKLPSESPSDFLKLLRGKSRPRSLAICLDEEKRDYERIIRSAMKVVGISRSEAIKYKKFAEESPDY